MPSKQTTNYKLSQRVKTDKVLMDDFNADNAKIDAAIKAVDAKADGLSSSKAEKTDVPALQTAVSGKGNCRVEVVTYTGDGSNTKSIRFSAKPMFFIVTGRNTLILGGGGSGDKANCVYDVDGRSTNNEVNASWSGSTLTLSGDVRATPNQNGYNYLAAAFFAMDA